MNAPPPRLYTYRSCPGYGSPHFIATRGSKCATQFNSTSRYIGLCTYNIDGWVSLGILTGSGGTNIATTQYRLKEFAFVDHRRWKAVQRRQRNCHSIRHGHATTTEEATRQAWNERESSSEFYSTAEKLSPSTTIIIITPSILYCTATILWLTRTGLGVNGTGYYFESI